MANARFRWDDIERLDGVVDGGVQADLMDGVEGLVERLTRWYLQNPCGMDMASEIQRDQAGFAEVVETLQAAGPEGWRELDDDRLAELEGADVPERAARFAAGVDPLAFAPDILVVTRESKRSIGEVTDAMFVAGERLYLNLAERLVADLPMATRWQRRAQRTQVDDLHLLRRHVVCRSVLGAYPEKSVDEAFDLYIEARGDGYKRLTAMVESVGASGGEEGSLATVLVHQIRQTVL